MEYPVLQYRCGEISAQLENRSKCLVSSVEFSIVEKQSIALVGETGSGKTMIAQAIMRLLPSNVFVRNEEILFYGKILPGTRMMRKRLGVDIVYIPQNGHEFLDPSRTIRRQMYDNLKKIGIPRCGLESIAIEKLQKAGLTEPWKMLDKYSFQLSGGMAQRVVVALASASRARLVIADEPTNGMDYEMRFRFQDMLHQLFPDTARLVITHDIDVAQSCDTTIVLCSGRMMEKGDSASVLGSPKSPYTRSLIAAQVKNGMRETPVLRSGAGACPFYQRCEKAIRQCLVSREYRAENNVEWWCNVAT